MTIEIPPDPERIAGRLREQRAAVEEELRRIREAKRVSQETMAKLVGPGRNVKMHTEPDALTPEGMARVRAAMDAVPKPAPEAEAALAEMTADAQATGLYDRTVRMADGSVVAFAPAALTPGELPPAKEPDAARLDRLTRAMAAGEGTLDDLRAAFGLPPIGCRSYAEMERLAGVESSEQRAIRLRAKVASGLMTRDEARAELGLPPTAEGGR